MTPVEACLRRARVIRCAGRIEMRRDRLIADLKSREFLTPDDADRLLRELNDHDRRVGLLREHFEALGEVALRGAATVH